MISDVILEFLGQVISHPVKMNPSPSASTSSILTPLIEALLLEGSYAFKAPCYNSTLSNDKLATCQQGSQWSQTAQAIMAGDLRAGVQLETVDNFHRVYTVTPVHLPEVENQCDSQGDCKLETITVTENIYSNFDQFDTGLFPVAATEMKAKLMSRQSI